MWRGGKNRKKSFKKQEALLSTAMGLDLSLSLSGRLLLLSFFLFVHSPSFLPSVVLLKAHSRYILFTHYYLLILYDYCICTVCVYIIGPQKITSIVQMSPFRISFCCKTFSVGHAKRGEKGQDRHGGFEARSWILFCEIFPLLKCPPSLSFPAKKIDLWTSGP